MSFQVKTKAIKRKNVGDQIQPPPKRPRSLERLAALDLEEMNVQKFVTAQKLLITYLKSKHYDKLPDEVKTALETLKQYDIEKDEFLQQAKVTKSKTADLKCTYIPQAHIDIISTEDKEKFEEEEEEINNEKKNKDLTNRVLSNDQKCRWYCAVPLNVMNKMRGAMKGKFAKFQKLTDDDQLVLFYRILKSNNTYNSLAVVYDVGPRIISYVFESVLDLMFVYAEERVWWLDRDDNRAIMPQSFKDGYPEIEGGIHIFDCLEIATEIPSKVAHNIQSWSNYKKGFRVKVLVSVVPGGLIEFVSRAYGGRATDAQIVVGSGVLKKLKKCDCVMCDKGFPCIEEDVLNRGGFFVMPPIIRQNRQLNQKERKENLKTARKRVHVERGIERLRRFDIMKFLRHTQYKHFNKILIVLAFTVNNFGPLIRDKNCMYEEEVEKEDDINEDDLDAILREFDNAFEDLGEDDLINEEAGVNISTVFPRIVSSLFSPNQSVFNIQS